VGVVKDPELRRVVQELQTLNRQESLEYDQDKRRALLEQLWAKQEEFRTLSRARIAAEIAAREAGEICECGGKMIDLLDDDGTTKKGCENCGIRGDE